MIWCDPLEARLAFDVTTGAIFGQYYDNADFTNQSFTRSDPGIHFDWQNRAPLSRMAATNFSVRWMGQLRTTVAGVYTFRVDTDTSAKLRVRGQTLDLTPSGGTSSTATINLYENQVVDLQVDYTHTTGTAAHVYFDWMTPDGSAFSSIPANNLINTFAPPPSTFTNPVIGAGADPWVIQWQDEYIYVWSDGGRIWGSRAARLQDIGKATGTVLWTAPASGSYSRNVWAPELHRLDNQWYLYFAADNGTNANHRMYVTSRNLTDPLGSFASTPTKLAAVTDRWAIDGTVLELNGSRYFVWSGWPGTTDGEQDLYIARMNSPTSINGERVRISQPNLSWERNGLPINEGPEVLQRNGETHIIFSASGYWTNEYALGDLKLTGSDPMSPLSWTKTPTPVFSQANGVAGVGHASFVKSPDGKEDWIVYHAHKSATEFNDDRVVRAQPFTLNGGTPVFGQPISNLAVVTEPSGTPKLVTASLIPGSLVDAAGGKSRLSGLATAVAISDRIRFGNVTISELVDGTAAIAGPKTDSARLAARR